MSECIDPCDAKFTCLGSEHARQHSNRRGFSRAVGTKKSAHSAGGKDKRCVTHRGHRAKSFREASGENPLRTAVHGLVSAVGAAVSGGANQRAIRGPRLVNRHVATLQRLTAGVS